MSTHLPAPIEALATGLAIGSALVLAARFLLDRIEQRRTSGD